MLLFLDICVFELHENFRNSYLSFYWKKWFYIWYMALAWWLVPCLPFPGLPHIYFLFTMRLTNERVVVFLSRRSVQHLVCTTINVKWEGGGDVGPQCFVKDLLRVVNLVCKKEDSVSCWFKTHQPRQGQRPITPSLCRNYRLSHDAACNILFALVKVKQSVQVVVCVLSNGCLAPTFVRAKQVKYVAIRTHKCPEIKA
jgi:hypothetical protein